VIRLKTMSCVVLSSAGNVKSLNFKTLLNKLNAKRVFDFSVKVDGYKRVNNFHLLSHLTAESRKLDAAKIIVSD
jgi:hypothetical protein